MSRRASPLPDAHRGHTTVPGSAAAFKGPSRNSQRSASMARRLKSPQRDAADATIRTKSEGCDRASASRCACCANGIVTAAEGAAPDRGRGGGRGAS